MNVIELVTNKKTVVEISGVEAGDFVEVTKKRFSFNWKLFKERMGLYKLQIVGSKDILGVIYLTDIPTEKRIEIKLLACSVENKGKKKIYDGIAGCLIAFACQAAIIKYGGLACVSLVPKTVLRLHYIEKYGMIDVGWQLYLEGRSLNEIIIQYKP